MQDRKRHDEQDENHLLHSGLTGHILQCCFEVINSLGCGFLESVYKNALIVSIVDMDLEVRTDKGFEVIFKNRKIGLFIPDLIIEGSVIVELKCCENLLPEHQAQLTNYLKVTNIRVGLLVNFGRRRLQYKRVHHPAHPAACDLVHPVLSSESTVY